VNGSRTLTVMFTDMVDSTKLSVSDGEQAGREVRRRLFKLMRGAIAATGGTEVKNTGDGLMVTFPTVRAGLEAGVLMQRRAARSNCRGPHEIHLRIGLSVGDAAQEDGDWFGSPVNEAARLCDKDLAASDQVLVTEQVQRLADPKGPRLVHLGERELRGFPGLASVFEVEWDRPYPEERERPLPRLLEVARTPDFVARGKEVEDLAALPERAYAGPRQIAIVCGEPGIGKTTLAAEAASAARAEGIRILYGRNEEGIGTAYQPFVEILNQIVWDVPSTLLECHVAEHGGELRRLVPALSSRIPGVPEPQTADPEDERYQLYAGVADLIARVAEDPLLMIVDDLHWADQPTIDLLRFISRPEGAAFTLIATHRSVSDQHPLTALIADLQRGPVTPVELKGLDAPGVMALIERTGREAAEEQARSLRRETAGNPFFIKELLRSREEGADPESVPSQLTDVILQRVRALDARPREVLETAAVIGREFELELLSRALDVDELELGEPLGAADRAQLLDKLPDSPAKYVFPHALVPRALIEDLDLPRRRGIHGRVAQALEAIHGERPGAHAAELARHWGEAASGEGQPKAIRYSLEAGKHALEQLASGEAAYWYGQALKRHDRSPGDDAEQRCDILIGLGKAEALAGVSGHRERLFEAFEAARDLGDRTRAIDAALANGRGVYTAPGEVDRELVRVFEQALELVGDRDCVERAELLAHLSGELAFAKDPNRVRELSREALDIVRELDAPRTLIHVIAERAIAIWWPDTLESRRQEADEAMQAALDVGDTLARFHAHRCRAYASICAGDLEGAAADYDEALRLADRTPDPMAHWMARVIGSTIETIRGRFATGQALAFEAFTIADRNGQKDAQFVFEAQAGQIAFEQGGLAEPIMREAVAMNEQLFPDLPLMAGISALAAAEADMVDEALAALHRGKRLGYAPPDITWAGTIGSHAIACARVGDRHTASLLRPLLEPYAGQVAYTAANAWLTVDHHLGALARVEGRFEAAEAHLEDAAAMARRMQAPVWLARTQIEQARTRAALGSAHRDVTPLLEEAREVAATHGAAGVERDAKALISKPEGAVPA
jgi:class 3 adenylate cyclase/tetratricopeptide (TPR) repeat protein